MTLHCVIECCVCMRALFLFFSFLFFVAPNRQHLVDGRWDGGDLQDVHEMVLAVVADLEIQAVKHTDGTNHAKTQGPQRHRAYSYIYL